MKKRVLSLWLAVVMLFSCFTVGASSMSVKAAPFVTDIDIVQREMILPNNGYIYQDYGIFYDKIITDYVDYSVTFSDGSNRVLSYYDLQNIGITVDSILYTGEIQTVDNYEYLFACGKQSVSIECDNSSYKSYVEITSFLKWCSNLLITRDYENMTINYEDQKIHTYFWRIKPYETNMYCLYSSGWDNIQHLFTMFDANNKVVERRNGSWNLIKGKEYCLRGTYYYNDYCYSDVIFQLRPDDEHIHRFSAATCTKARTCLDCGFAKGEKLAHTYKKVTKTKATLTKNGTIRYKCTSCGHMPNKTITIKRPTSFKLSTTTYTYDGKVKSPVVTVKDSAGKTLKKNVDYTVTYASGRKNPGTYKVTIKMKGNYSGTKTLTFKINPPKTNVVKLTSYKTQMKVYISRKSSAAVTGYEVKYATNKNFKNAKIKKITKYSTGSVTLTGLKKNTTQFIRVRTYKKVGGKTYYSAWSSIAWQRTKK